MMRPLCAQPTRDWRCAEVSAQLGGPIWRMALMVEGVGGQFFDCVTNGLITAGPHADGGCNRNQSGDETAMADHVEVRLGLH